MDLRIERTNQADMGELIQFAHSFNHDLAPSEWPLYEGFRDEKRLGYFFIVDRAPIIYPSVHPHCTPREVLEIVRLVKSRLEINGASASALVPDDSKAFTPRIMAKLGFTSTGTTLYVSKL